MFKRIASIRNNISIRRRLNAIIFIVAIFIIAFSFALFSNITKVNYSVRNINSVYLENIIRLSNLVEHLYASLLENYILSGNSLDPGSVNAAIDLDLINASLDDYRQSLKDESQKILFQQFTTEFNNYLAVLKSINVLKLTGNFDQIREIRSTKEIKVFRKMQNIIKTLILYNANEIKKNNLKIHGLQSKSIRNLYLYSVIFLLFSIIFFSLLIKDIAPSLNKLKLNLGIISKGQIPAELLEESDNETGAMAILINHITRNYTALINFAIEIRKGNYDNDYGFLQKDDLIGKSLIDLRDNLKLSKIEDEKRKIDDQKRNWINEGHALFSEILRQRSGEIINLTDNIIKNIVYYLKANQGGLFLISDVEKEKKIELVSAFAYDRKKFFEKTIDLGDGLIGTVALEGNSIYLKEIPENYIEIESGLGDANPKSLLIVPLKFEDEILGVVEIASFSEFNDYEITFVEELAQSIASTLLTAKNNAKTEQLLEDSRKQSEELAAQDIEMRQNIEEMRSAQELAKRRETDLTGIVSAVDNTLMKGEYDINGTLLSVNNRHLKTMGYDLSEIKGKNIEIFIPHEELENFRNLWKSVVEGNPRQVEVKRKTKSGDTIWLINQYTPVKDETGRISKVLYLAHDVTRYKKGESGLDEQIELTKTKEVTLQKRINELNVVKNEISDKDSLIKGVFNAININTLLLEFDMNGIIINVNDNFLKLFNKKREEMIGHKMEECLNIERTKEEFDKIWNELKKGNKHSSVAKFKFEDGHEIWLEETYSMLFDENNKPYKVLNLSYDISRLIEVEEKNKILLNEAQNYSKSLLDKDKEMQDAIRDLLNQESEMSNGLKNYQLIVDNLEKNYPIFEIDKQKNIVHVNKLLCELTEFSEKELIQNRINYLLSGKQNDEILRAVKSGFNNHTISIEAEIKCNSGKIKPIKFAIFPILGQDGDIYKIMFLVIEQYPSEINTDKIKEQQFLLEEKSRELANLKQKLMKAKSEKSNITFEELTDKESDKLYHNWLTKLKEQIKT